MSAAERTNTLEGVNRRDEPQTGGILRRRGLYYGLTTAFLSILMLLAVVGALAPVDTFGVSSERVGADGGGYELDVRYATVTRGGLATPFEIEVRRDDGFDGPVTIAVDRDYIKMWDENGLLPGPSSETTMGESLVWEFDPPIGDSLRFSFDARIEPAIQSGRTGRVAVLEDDAPVVEVDFRTRVLP
ncbi:MAG: hypothetical protein ABWZ76_10530 [Acidimicrobiales bacterium]